MFTPSPVPQRSSYRSTPWDHLVPTAPAVLLHPTPAAARKTVPSLQPCVIIIIPGGPRLRSVEPLFLVWKLVRRQEDVHTLPARLLPPLLCSRRFLIDSGATVSVFPAPRSSSSFSGVQLLLTADGSSLSCSGSRVIPLRLGNHRFEWPFQLAPVAVPILGADFLKHYNLLLDVSNQRVFSADSPTSPSIILPTSPDSTSAPLKANLLATPKCISDLLAKFPDVVSSDGFTASKPRHGVTHHLLMQPGPPVFAKARRLDPEKLASVKKEFSAMEKAGIIRRSNSPWSSPLHMVKKKDGGWRPCGDYRGLNIVTVPNRYPLPNIADFTTRVSGSTIFSKLNLQKGYYQVPMAEEDICKTAIITLFGMFEFLRLPLASGTWGTPSREWWILSSEIFLIASPTLMISWCLAAA